MTDNPTLSPLRQPKDAALRSKRFGDLLDEDSDLPIEILHECEWFNPADNDDSYMEANFLFYRFKGVPEEVVVLVDLSDPYAAEIMNPEYGAGPEDSVLAYLRRRFECVKQTNGNGFTILWDEWP